MPTASMTLRRTGSVFLRWARALLISVAFTPSDRPLDAELEAVEALLVMGGHGGLEHGGEQVTPQAGRRVGLGPSDARRAAIFGRLQQNLRRDPILGPADDPVPEAEPGQGLHHLDVEVYAPPSGIHTDAGHAADLPSRALHHLEPLLAAHPRRPFGQIADVLPHAGRRNADQHVGGDRVVGSQEESGADQDDRAHDQHEYCESDQRADHTKTSVVQPRSALLYCRTMPPSGFRFHHVAVQTADLSRARRFYEAALGCVV